MIINFPFVPTYRRRGDTLSRASLPEDAARAQRSWARALFAGCTRDSGTDRGAGRTERSRVRDEDGVPPLDAA
jgi:hypothetical protein